MPILIDTTTSIVALGGGSGTQRHIVKTSLGKLVLFENKDGDLQYKTSSDNGLTWDISWTIAFTVGTIANFDVYIDTNDDIYLAMYSSAAYFKKLTYSGGSWTLGSNIVVVSGIQLNNIVFIKNSNGDFWILGRYSSGNGIRGYYSTNGGTSWSSYGAITGINTYDPYVMIVGSELWLFCVVSGAIKKYVYTTSWDAGTTIVSGITQGAGSLGAIKISDSNIYIACRSSSGLKVFNYNGTIWDSGTLLTNTSLDYFPSLSNINNNPIVYWRNYNGTTWDIYYRKYNGSSWNSEVAITSDSVDDKFPSSLLSDSQYAYVTWVAGSASPYNIYFQGLYPTQEIITSDTIIKQVNIQKTILSNSKIVTKELKTIESDTKIFVSGNQVNINSDTLIKWVDIQKNILSDTLITNSKLVYISSDTKIKVEDIQKTILSDTAILLRTQTDILSNTSILSRIQKILLSDTLISLRFYSTIFSSTIILPPYQNKFILRNKLYIITDTIPAKLIEVDISNPSPTYTTYILNASGETLDNGKDLDIDLLSGCLFGACSGGNIVKAQLSDLSIREQFNTGETSDLFNVALLKTFNYSYFGDNIDGNSIFVLDESIKESLNMDFRTLASQQAILSTNINTIIADTMNTDLRFLSPINSILYTDLRFKFAAAPVPMKREDFTVYIDGVLANDTILSSINVNHVADARSTATFDLSRNHDDFNTVLIGTGTTINNKNSVQIYLSGILIFTGNISKLSCDGNNEKVSIYCEGIEWNTLEDTDFRFVSPANNIVNLSLSEKNKQLDLYDVLVDNIEIDNPIINIDDVNPKFYTGVKINLGKYTQEHNGQTWVLSSGLTDEEIEKGDFKFKPNSTYFWVIDYQDYRLPTFFSGQVRYNAYIGTSLAPASRGMYKILGAHYDYQTSENNSETELGEYILGIAPFKEISSKNGKYTSASKWEDDEVGMWSVWGESYDYIDFAKAVAAIEYERIKNINGAILPNTSANIEITLDAFIYYQLKLLTRINLEKTINTTIYKNNNGFPVSIKNISIDASNMKVILSCDNKKSQWEINNYYPYPVEPEILPSGKQLKHFKTYLPTGDESYGV